MVKQGLIAGLLVAALAAASGAHAQTANATAPNSNAGGANQAQQFPSGGTTAPNGAGAPGAGQSQIGAPTAVEQQEQKKSDANMQICKGC